MINTREIADEYRLSHWAQVMQERNQSGLTIKAYCREIGICTNTYYYWQRKLRSAAIEQVQTSLVVPNFTEVNLEISPVQPALPEAIQVSRVCVEIGEMRISADNAYPPDKLAALLRELTRLC